MGCAGCGGLGATLMPSLKTGGGIPTSYPCPVDHAYFPKSTPLCDPKFPYKSTLTGQMIPGNPQTAGSSSVGGGGSSTMLYVVGGLAVLGIAAYLYLK